MILFEKVRWKNFLSTGNQYSEIRIYKLSRNYFNQLGSEWYVVRVLYLDALTFSLFGKPFRKINKGQLINSTNEKDCRVEVEFSIGTT